MPNGGTQYEILHHTSQKFLAGRCCSGRGKRETVHDVLPHACTQGVGGSEQACKESAASADYFDGGFRFAGTSAMDEVDGFDVLFAKVQAEIIPKEIQASVLKRAKSNGSPTAVVVAAAAAEANGAGEFEFRQQCQSLNQCLYGDASGGRPWRGRLFAVVETGSVRREVGAKRRYAVIKSKKFHSHRGTDSNVLSFWKIRSAHEWSVMNESTTTGCCAFLILSL
jgi:hypothetical protein